MDKSKLASKIEHTNLKPEATIDDIVRLCDEAKQYSFFGVCVNSQYVKKAKECLVGSNCKVVTVAGFPLGSSISKVKAEEAIKAVDAGADEVDMVLSVGFLRSKEYDYVKKDIEKVVNAVLNSPVKVIIETALLNEQQKRKACEIVKLSGAAFVKTSTGFSKGGATVEDIKLMRDVVGTELGIKAAGGIRDFDTAMSMIEAGADRLGCSSSINIMS